MVGTAGLGASIVVSALAWPRTAASGGPPEKSVINPQTVGITPPRPWIEIEDPAHEPVRYGLTFVIDAGGGLTRWKPDGLPPLSVAPSVDVDVAIGGWLSPRAALVLHAGGTAFSDELGRRLHGFAGPAVHVAFGDNFLAAGVGAGRITASDGPTERGLVFDVRLGLAVRPRRSHALEIIVCATRGAYESGAVTGGGLRVAWQLF